MKIEAIELKTVFIGLLVGLAHIASGIAVFIDPHVMLTAPLASIHHIANMFHFSNGFGAAILIGAGAMAVIGASYSFIIPRTLRSILFAPQQILLLLQIWSISTALVTGTYPDGYSPVGGGWFILGDQIWAWILAVSHSIWLAAFIYRSAANGRDS